MSITVSNWKDICDAPTNRSPSKMAFSFSRANRFNNQKENKYPSHYFRSQMFYEVGGKVSKRATSFGYGTKYDFTKE